MGPGTHIISRVYSDTQPVNKNDFLALLHDIQYLQCAGVNPTYPDKLAIVQSDYSLSGFAMKLGLLSRYAFGLQMNDNLEGLTHAQTRSIGDTLMKIIKERNINLFRLYNVDPDLYPAHLNVM
jgi:hypothetical protein